MISVAICTFNGERYIADMLLSILNQTRPPDELIIIDDCSTDNTLEEISKVMSEDKIPVDLEVNTQQLGIVANFEKALQKCRGDWILVADQDDQWLPEKIATLACLTSPAQEENKATLVYSDAAIIDEHSNNLMASYMRSENLVFPKHNLSSTFSVINIIPGCTMMINKHLLHLATPFPKDIVMHDWWLALIASLTGRIIFSPKVLMNYRMHENSAWGLDKNKNLLKRTFTQPTGTTERLKQNYLRTIRQCLAAKQHLDEQGIMVPTRWLTLSEQLSSNSPRRFVPFITGQVNRQGGLRWISYFLGALMTLFTKIEVSHDRTRA